MGFRALMTLYKLLIHCQTGMSVLVILGRKCTMAGRVACCPLVIHVEYTPTGQTLDSQTDGRTDGRQTVTLYVYR